LAGDVRVRGQLAYRDALQEMCRADVLVLLDGPGRKIGVPAKLYEYFGAGRPILALTEPDGDTAQVLRESGVRHRIASPKDVPRIRQALAELACEIAAAPAAMPGAELLRRFTRQSIAGDLAGILDGVLAGSPRRLEDSPAGLVGTMAGVMND
jgi:hypothetical protein